MHTNSYYIESKAALPRMPHNTLQQQRLKQSLCWRFIPALARRHLSFDFACRATAKAYSAGTPVTTVKVKVPSQSTNGCGVFQSWERRRKALVNHHPSWSCSEANVYHCVPHTADCVNVLQFSFQKLPDQASWSLPETHGPLPIY